MPALTGRVALFLAHVLVLESSPSNAEEALGSRSDTQLNQRKSLALCNWLPTARVLHDAKARKHFTASGR